MHEIDQSPQMAAHLFEMLLPRLSPPTAVMQEMMSPPGTLRFEVRCKDGPFRVKIAADPVQASGLLKGAALLAPLAARGVPAPRMVSAHGRLHGSDVTATIETRLGTTDGLAGWRVLGTPGRIALAEESAKGLLLLHGLSVDDLPPLRTPKASGRPWREVLRSRAERLSERLRGAGVFPEALSRRVDERLRAGVDRMPDAIDRRPCHGAFGLDAIAVERRVFAGLKDFEFAVAGDPWMDVAYWLGSTGEPESAPARRFYETYRAHAEAPDDLSTRFDVYAALTVLRAMSQVCDGADEDLRAGLRGMAESWIAHPPRVWT